MSDNQGFSISYDHGSYEENKVIVVQGTLSTLVKCGSQYAVWHQFPQAVRYTLKDLDSASIYHSVDMALSISENGDEVYAHYAKEPCGKVVSQDFSIVLNDIYFQQPPKEEISHFQLYAEYWGFTSNSLTFAKTPLQIKGF